MMNIFLFDFWTIASKATGNIHCKRKLDDGVKIPNYFVCKAFLYDFYGSIVNSWVSAGTGFQTISYFWIAN